MNEITGAPNRTGPYSSDLLTNGDTALKGKLLFQWLKVLRPRQIAVVIWLAVCVKARLIDRDVIEICRNTIRIGSDTIPSNHITKNSLWCNYNRSRSNCNSLKQKCHIGNILVTGCTGHCQNDNLQVQLVTQISSKYHFRFSVISRPITIILRPNHDIGCDVITI